MIGQKKKKQPVFCALIGQKDVMEAEVLAPLNRLLVMFQGPNKVIKKRHDKLLDYDNVQSKVKGAKDATQQKIVSLAFPASGRWLSQNGGRLKSEMWTELFCPLVWSSRVRRWPA